MADTADPHAADPGETVANALVARYAKLTATIGRGAHLAAELLQAAERLHNEPGCEIYLINRSRTDPDEIWVTELWSDISAVERSLASDEARANIGRVMQLLAKPPEVIELEQCGGLVRRTPHGAASASRDS